jgi:cyclopropane fatty-acyl-phospholipid synthase-like methyltransferase
VNCKICHKTANYSFSKNNFKIFKCTVCGFGQTLIDDDKFLPYEFYNQDYFNGKSAHYAQPNNQSAYISLKWWIDHFTAMNARHFLEIGPGPACMLACYLLETRKNISYTAVEISKDACKNIHSKGFEVYCGSITDPCFLNANHEKFDSIIATEVIEHDSRPIEFALALYSLLKCDGKVSITTGNFNGLNSRFNGVNWYYIDPPAHLSFYTPDSIKKLFIDAGFRKVKIFKFGFSYIDFYLKYRIPGFLKLVDMLGISTGMTIIATK